MTRPGEADWWRSAVVYQIYPRSFSHHNRDGTGDILGIIDRLPYLAQLGIDALWISPWNLAIFLMAACLSALLYVAVLAAAGERPARDTAIPFGPFIAAGLMLTWLLEISGLPTLAPNGG